MDQFNKYYPKFLKQFDTTPGIKYHLLNHMYEFILCYKWSPSYVDDQRIESMHPFIRLSWRKYVRYGSDKRLLYVGKDLNNRVLFGAKQKSQSR